MSAYLENRYQRRVSQSNELAVQPVLRVSARFGEDTPHLHHHRKSALAIEGFEDLAVRFPSALPGQSISIREALHSG